MGNINYTLNHELCTGCGICEGSCPKNAITTGVKEGVFRPVLDKNKCIDCGRCVKTCPGFGINLMDIARDLYNDYGIQQDKMVGRYLKCFTGYSNDNDLRYHAASGGVLSQFLIWLLENDKIDGAVVTKFDKDAPLKVKTFIATTKEDILSARGSKYAPVSHQKTAQLIKGAEGSRYVIVGVPCHIEGFRKLISVDKKLREKVVGLFGIYCSGTRTFGFTEYIMKERGIDLEKLDYLAYRDNGCLGGMVAKGEGIDFYEDYQSYCHPLRTIFFPRRCLLCADHFAELADLSFGDIHVKPYSEDTIGINSIIVRNSSWGHWLIQSASNGAITLNELEPSTLLESQKMAKVKKTRNMGYILLNQKLGYAVPDFGSLYDGRLTPKIVINYSWTRIQQFIGSHKSLWWMIRFIKAKVNMH